jgi:hypothetical protein
MSTGAPRCRTGLEVEIAASLAFRPNKSASEGEAKHSACMTPRFFGFHRPTKDWLQTPTAAAPKKCRQNNGLQIPY